MNLKYKRVLLKLSGESLSGKIGHGIDFDTVVKICEPIKKIVDMGCEVAIVVGGGNFWRGRSSGSMDRTRTSPPIPAQRCAVQKSTPKSS